MRIKDRLTDIDKLLKHSTIQKWKEDFERRVIDLSNDLKHYQSIKEYYHAASLAGEQLQVIIEQSMPGQVGKYDILSSPLEFWMADGDFVPLKHPVSRRLFFPGLTVSLMEDALEFNEDPLVLLFIEADKPGASPYSAEDYVKDMAGDLRRGWKKLGYPKRNLGIIRLDWPRATVDNILKVIEGDPQPYFDVVDAEIQRLKLRLSRAKGEEEEKEKQELERDLERAKRFAEEQKPLIENILKRTPRGLVHWVGPMEYNEAEKRFSVLPVCPTSENESRELLSGEFVGSISEAKQRIRWQFLFLTSYTMRKEESRPPESSVNYSNLSNLIQQIQIKGQVSSVLAFLRPIHREAAKSLFNTFYFYFSAFDSAGLPQALLQARKELHDSHRDTCHYAWAIPIFFQLPEREDVREPPEKGEIAMDAQTALQLAAISSWLLKPFIKLGAEGFVKKVGEKVGEEFVVVAKSVLEKVSAGARVDQPEEQLAQFVKDLSKSDPAFSTQGQKLTEGVWPALSRLLNQPGVTPDDILRIYQYLADDATKHGRNQAEQVNYLITYAHKPGKLVQVLKAIQDACPDLLGE